MKIVIVASIQFTYEIEKITKKLERLGHKVEIPWAAKKILKGDIDYNDFMSIKEKRGDNEFRNKAEEDLIIRYYKLIKKGDAILVLNYDKKGIKNYIGGNALIEMSFAHILSKPIYLINPIPEMIYTDEIKAMKPILINGDLSKIK